MILTRFRHGGARCVNLIRPLVVLEQDRTITGKAFRGSPIERPDPFPYKKIPFNTFTSLFDTTVWRFDENSKVIVVEGPPAVGKTALAKALAEDLELRHFPEPTMDHYYINGYGYDLRQLDSKLPEDCRSFDIKNFLKTPTHKHSAFFQLAMYQLRYSQYVDALAHLLNSGQGVVLERSPYSDYVFTEAMAQEGYLSKQAKKGYYEIEDNTIHELLRPHLIIYLDAPVSVIQQKIAQRGLSHECNSKVFTPSYLSAIEKTYKQSYLKKASVHAELMVYDWSQGGDVESVIEDIERIDFEEFEKDKLNPKMKDWRYVNEFHLTCHRIEYSSRKVSLMQNFNLNLLDVTELHIDPYDAKKWDEEWRNAPGMKYAKGFNQDMGDKNVLFRSKIPSRPEYMY